MFTLYEACGAVTNLVAGVAGARWGIKRTLVSGLALQLVGLGMLLGWDEGWGKAKATVFVTVAQALCGVAKDLTKLGGKTVTKLVTPEGKQLRLFKLVAWLTGFKNSLKGLGYFLGAALLSVSYEAALLVNMALILLAIPWAAVALRKELGRSDKQITLRSVFEKPYNVNVLSFARLFLFGSRDLWFEVPLPFFLRDAGEGLGWGRTTTGAVLALWIIGYGQVQSWAPQTILAPLKQSPPNKWHSWLWVSLLLLAPAALGAIVDQSDRLSHTAFAALLVAGLAVFAFIFAVNSSIHSYLIVRYSDNDKVAMSVGFYYMANAIGRLTGTLASGALYSHAGSGAREGFAACFWASVAFLAVTAAATLAIKDDAGGLTCGRFACCLPETAEQEEGQRQEEAAEEQEQEQEDGGRNAV